MGLPPGDRHSPADHGLLPCISTISNAAPRRRGVGGIEDHGPVEAVNALAQLNKNVLPGLQERFAQSYRAAGGTCDLEIFEGCDHAWVDDPGPQTDRAIEVVKAFIARALA